MKKLIILSFLAMMTTFTVSKDKFEIGAYMGYANYLGDLVEPSFTFDQAKFAGGVLLRYQVMNKVQLRSSMVVGKLAGDDNNYSSNVTRAAKFESPFTELALIAEYEFLKIKRTGKNALDHFSPYVFAGIGFNLLRLDKEIGSTSPEVSADLAEHYSDIQPIVPFGLGLKYAFLKNWTVGAELGMRATFTDYLDGVSQAGDPTTNDIYFSGGASISYILGNTDADNDGIVDKKDACPNLPGPAKFKGCPDTDGDGLTDAEDECPKEFGRALLDGCPDSDEDGVSDKFDDCPNDKGIRRFGGCPDTDNDGIVDLEDNCPEEAGIPSLNGCPDSDRDGVSNSKDECPFEPGPIALNGCPDKDNDGVPDKDDACPDLPGKLTTKGCPDQDTDHDGIIDRKDRCPYRAGPLDNNGCPIIKQEDQSVLDYAMAHVAFETGSDELLPSSLEVLDKIADILIKYQGYSLHIYGHTDNVGDPEENRVLSEDRARSCYNYFFIKGVNLGALTYKGFGATKPIAGNETEVGRIQNRRVEFILTMEEN